MRKVALALLATLACSGKPSGPASLDPRNDACAYCRMAVSDPRFASQLVAPREEPRFFDDLGCLRDFLRDGPPPPGAVAFVADHRTREWIPAAGAVYTRNPRVQTPMGSHLVAHRDAASRDADRAIAGGTSMTAAEIFGPAGPPDGRR